jgi:hypothetical protein
MIKRLDVHSTDEGKGGRVVETQHSVLDEGHENPGCSGTSVMMA